MKTLFFLFLFPFSNIYGQPILTIKGITYDHSATENDEGVNIPRSLHTDFSFLYNHISSVANSGYLLQAGDEFPGPTNNNLDGEIISGNYFTWSGTGKEIETHGIFVAYNINSIITYNYLYAVPMSIVQKGGTNIDGVVAYNIINNPQWDGVNVKGMDNVNIYNNTFYSAQQFYNKGVGTGEGLVEIYENDNPLHTSRGTHIYNNIFYTVNQIDVIRLDETDDQNGFQSDYNLIYCESGTPMFQIGSTRYTFTQWQRLGYDTHSVVANPNFNDFINFVPSSPLRYGIKTKWGIGLAGNATWSTSSLPATGSQNGKWQVGARILSAREATAHQKQIKGQTH
jgi:hypothetical protein